MFAVKHGTHSPEVTLFAKRTETHSKVLCVGALSNVEMRLSGYVCI